MGGWGRAVCVVGARSRREEAGWVRVRVRVRLRVRVGGGVP